MTATTQRQAEERHTAPLLRRIYGRVDLNPVARFVGLLWLAGLALWAAILLGIGPVPAPINLPWPVLALLFFAAERFVVDLEVRQQTHSFSLSEIALLLALIFAAPADLLIGQTIGAGLALSLRPGQRPIKFLFNLANFALCSAVALIVFRVILGANDALGLFGWAGAFAATFASDTVAAAGVAVVIWLSQRERPNIGSLFGVGTIYTVVAPSVALLAATVLWFQPIASWLLVVLGLMVYVMLRWNGRELRRHRSVSQLNESTRRIQSSFTLDDVARALLTTARDMFDAELAELLLFATILPIYWISRTRHDLYDIPVWGSIPLWVCLLLIGRELAMTGFRWWAQRRGIVIPAAGAGKLKATIQNIYIGATFLWFTFRDARKPMGWEHNRFAEYWNQFHGGVVALTLALATALTVYSFAVYLYRYRTLFKTNH